MKYDVTVSPRESEYTLSIEAASPQLAARHAWKRYGCTCDVTSVNGVACLGKCERCERHVFEDDKDKRSGEGGVMCSLCIKELACSRM